MTTPQISLTNLMEHLIVLPPHIEIKLIDEAPRFPEGGPVAARERWLIQRAAQLGADHELEACCIHILQILAGIYEDKVEDWKRFVELLKDERRPSLNKQAIDALEISLRNGYINAKDGETIRRALKSLPDSQD